MFLSYIVEVLEVTQSLTPPNKLGDNDGNSCWLKKQHSSYIQSNMSAGIETPLIPWALWNNC